MRTCPKCKAEKPDAEFYERGTKQCRECWRVYQREYARARRATWGKGPKPYRVPDEQGRFLCKGCGERFADEEFVRVSKGGARRAYCRPCWAARMAAYREANPDRVRKYEATRRERWSERNNAERRERYASDEEYRKQVLALSSKLGKRWRTKLRGKVLEGYGGKCVCCGEAEPLFLALDHVQGKGGKLRRECPMHMNGTTLHRWIIDQGFPPEFQVLCHNCNHGRSLNGGVCPHQQAKE